MSGKKRVIKFSGNSYNYRFDMKFQTDTIAEVPRIKNVRKPKSN